MKDLLNVTCLIIVVYIVNLDYCSAYQAYENTYSEKPYKCELCDYCSAQKSWLTQHMRTHTGEKPYNCESCNYSGAWKCHLLRHMRTHSSEKLSKHRSRDYDIV